MEYWDGTAERPVLGAGVQRLFALNFSLKGPGKLFFITPLFQHSNTPSNMEEKQPAELAIFDLARGLGFSSLNKTNDHIKKEKEHG